MTMLAFNSNLSYAPSLDDVKKLLQKLEIDEKIRQNYWFLFRLLDFIDEDEHDNIRVLIY